MDIVDRLREMADLFEAQQAPHNLVLHLRTGADEIDRLRAGGCARDQGLTQHCAEAAALTAENERLRTERSNLLGSARHQEARADALTARVAELERMLDLYRDAVLIDVTMEGPKFMGSNASALKRAWDEDYANFTQPTPMEKT